MQRESCFRQRCLPWIVYARRNIPLTTRKAMYNTQTLHYLLKGLILPDLSKVLNHFVAAKVSSRAQASRQNHSFGCVQFFQAAPPHLGTSQVDKSGRNIHGLRVS